MESLPGLGNTLSVNFWYKVRRLCNIYFQFLVEDIFYDDGDTDISSKSNQFTEKLIIS